MALGIGSDQRHALLPEVPTLAQAGVGQVNVDMWYGVFAPAAKAMRNFSTGRRKKKVSFTYAEK